MDLSTNTTIVYNIKVTGEGTIPEIIKSLETLKGVLSHMEGEEYNSHEDSTLYSEIKEKVID